MFSSFSRAIAIFYSCFSIQMIRMTNISIHVFLYDLYDYFFMNGWPKWFAIMALRSILVFFVSQAICLTFFWTLTESTTFRYWKVPATSGLNHRYGTGQIPRCRSTGHSGRFGKVEPCAGEVDVVGYIISVYPCHAHKSEYSQVNLHGKLETHHFK